MDEIPEPKWRTVEHLARELLLAQEELPHCGQAIFLVGAGCSVSAGIPPARGVAQHCALHLARKYSQGGFTSSDEAEALAYLVDSGHVDRAKAFPASDTNPDWSGLYPYFFSEHLKSPNHQREIIFRLVEAAGGKLNWAHACLGELVKRRFVNSVLTTNFDQLVLTGIFRTGIIPVVADGLFALNRIVAEPLVPQVIHLHGSMHTYALRNSPEALAEPMRDPRAVSMVNNILQRSSVLVVVGYAGGEEGLMEMLLETAASLEQLVVYWVSYEDDAAKLSPRCRKLLAGENKFAISGGEADRFFGDLMARLRIGQPGWVADPIGDLDERKNHLVAPDEIAEVSILISDYRTRIEAAAKTPEVPLEDQKKGDAARFRASGEYARARAALDGIDLSKDNISARLHAQNALSIFEESQGRRSDMLEFAEREFGELITRTTGRDRLDNVVSLLDARFDAFEAAPEDKAGEVLNDIVQIATKWLEIAEKEGDVSGHGRLLYYRALAHHRRADASEEDVQALEAAVKDYKAALDDLEKGPDRFASAIEAREGLAAALQVLGRKGSEPETVREAVRLFREVADHARLDTTSPEGAGLLYNLAGALLDLMNLVDAEEAAGLAREARAVLGRAEQAFSRAKAEEQLADVRKRVENLDFLVRGLEAGGAHSVTANLSASGSTQN